MNKLRWATVVGIKYCTTQDGALLCQLHCVEDRTTWKIGDTTEFSGQAVFTTWVSGDIPFAEGERVRFIGIKGKYCLVDIENS